VLSEDSDEDETAAPDSVEPSKVRKREKKKKIYANVKEAESENHTTTDIDESCEQVKPNLVHL